MIIDEKLQISFYKEIALKVWPNLKSVFLTNSLLSDEGCYNLITAKMPNLTSIRICNNLSIKMNAISLK